MDWPLISVSKCLKKKELIIDNKLYFVISNIMYALKKHSIFYVYAFKLPVNVLENKQKLFIPCPMILFLVMSLFFAQYI